MLEYYQRPQFAPFSLEYPDPNPERLGVMLVHGFTGTPMDMRPLAEALFNLGADCHVIGLPGHGTDIANLQTMTEAKWRHAVQAAWMAHVRRYPRRMLVGYSMGGAAALQMAAQFAPDLLILLAPFVRINDRRAPLLPIAGRLMKEVKLLSNMDFDDPIVRQWLRAALPDLDIDDPGIQRQLREETEIPGLVINELRKFGRAGRRVASSVRCPVVIIQGHRDFVVSPRDSRRLSDAFTDLKAYHEIPGDHLLTLTALPWWPRVRELVLDESRELQPFAPSGLDAGGG